ncbi:MAG: bifunctional diaminohydroxyphosphoribosylaminopyrimidine deaminase/5-amino-6-(5-phosphoribosylamino)uracil reductase RibD [Bradymonadales bacterium]|nr:MAG: bifunctional diaminohydroxyphosphoribosylaminopyrimidine deaminase/5-amino-6-(5-phosphoribosylamino)uracil reductase RibD [Bradymonadales bacterium]
MGISFFSPLGASEGRGGRQHSLAARILLHIFDKPSAERLLVKKSAQPSSEKADWMRSCLELADSPKDSCLPNPRVGALILHRNKVISKAFHAGPGKAHAEALAIQRARSKGFRKFSEASLYINLEPCCHLNKRTPPCLPLVLDCQFKEIFIAHPDPNPQVAGRSIRALRRSGAKVEVGLLKEEAEDLNQAFLKNQQEGMPLVRLKAAMSFDGRWACPNGESKWISGERSRALVHHWRAKSQFIGIGYESLKRDGSRLNARLGRRSKPKNILVFGGPKRLGKNLPVIKANGMDRVHQIPSGVDLRKSLQTLYKEKGVCEIFLEGGPRLATSFLEADLVDHWMIFYGRGLIGGSARYTIGADWALKSPQESIKFQPQRVELLGSDVFVEGKLHVYRSRTK